MIAAFILGVLVGAVMGLTGAGGGILGVPALVFGMGWAMQEAAPVALIAVAVSAAIGAIEGLRTRLVRYRAALLMAAAGMAVTPLGMRAAQMLSQRWLTLLFSIAMLIAAWRLFKSADPEIARIEWPLPGTLHPHTGRFDWNWPTAALLGAIGAATGFITGLLGVGGGFIMVPLLRRFTNVSMHGIVATSLLVIALVSTSSVINTLMHHHIPPLEATFVFTGAAASGMLLGRKFARRLSAQYVQYGFASILTIIAVGMILHAAVL
ncbi:MAG: sulfite exporter TauE/SafE family protein [Burkholderiales bacterium]|nr:sulfite exporter TauE/SafE family protein [Burkholderiales bacterium]